MYKRLAATASIGQCAQQVSKHNDVAMAIDSVCRSLCRDRLASKNGLCLQPFFFFFFIYFFFFEAVGRGSLESLQQKKKKKNSSVAVLYFAGVSSAKKKKKKTARAVDSRDKQKKVSASTNMAYIFTGGRSVFFLLKIFYTQIRYANLYFSGAGNSNSGTA